MVTEILSNTKLNLFTISGLYILFTWAIFKIIYVTLVIFEVIDRYDSSLLALVIFGMFGALISFVFSLISIFKKPRKLSFLIIILSIVVIFDATSLLPVLA